MSDMDRREFLTIACGVVAVTAAAEDAPAKAVEPEADVVQDLWIGGY